VEGHRRRNSRTVSAFAPPPPPLAAPRRRARRPAGVGAPLGSGRAVSAERRVARNCGGRIAPQRWPEPRCRRSQRVGRGRSRAGQRQRPPPARFGLRRAACGTEVGGSRRAENLRQTPKCHSRRHRKKEKQSLRTNLFPPVCMSRAGWTAGQTRD
jgi:hypothetical protein